MVATAGILINVLSYHESAVGVDHGSCLPGVCRTRGLNFLPDSYSHIPNCSDQFKCDQQHQAKEHAYFPQNCAFFLFFKNLQKNGEK
jgi:hypothetical protein